MRHFKWHETTNIVNQENRAILGIRAENFISRGTGQSSSRIQGFCSPLNIMLFIWLVLVISAAVWLIAIELVPHM